LAVPFGAKSAKKSLNVETGECAEKNGKKREEKTPEKSKASPIEG
jgi:hypothetical protein